MSVSQNFARLQDKRGREAEERLFILLKNNRPKWCCGIEKTQRYGIADCLGVDIILYTEIGHFYLNVTTTIINKAYSHFSRKIKKKLQKGWITKQFAKRIKHITVNENRNDYSILESVELKYLDLEKKLRKGGLMK